MCIPFFFFQPLTFEPRSPKLLSFSFDRNRNLAPLPATNVSGNVLDITSLDEQGNIAVSVDNVHEPDSVKSQRNKAFSSQQKLLHTLTMVIDSGELRWDERPNSAFDAINQRGTFDLVVSDDVKEAQQQAQKLRDSLYSVGNLRKRVSGGEE